MFSWLRLNPDPHHASSITFSATGGITRGGRSVESRPCCDSLRLVFHRCVLSRTPCLRGSAFFMSLDRHISTAASTKFHHQSDGLVFVQ